MFPTNKKTPIPAFDACEVCRRRPILLHFDHRGRKLECRQVPRRNHAIRKAERARVALARYQDRLAELPERS
jgi:hypothetical protein